MNTVYYGEILCMAKTGKGENCKNKAYYLCNNSYVCGVHSRNKERIELCKNENKNIEKLEKINKDEKYCDEIAKLNKEKGIKGNVIVVKMKMMRKVEDHDGFIKVFPNYKHNNRIDGLGISSLSPFNIGPIKHGQPKLPDALCLENYHQYSKAYPNEVDEKGEPTKLFFDNQIKGFLDKEGHRHKEEAKNIKGNKNIPLFSVWIDKDGKLHKVSYFESRQFYCHFYERGIKNNKDFLKLKQMLNDGYNLQICGYDGYDIDKSVEECYKDISKPFGHEICLYTMLVHDENEYPWNKYKTFDF